VLLSFISGVDYFGISPYTVVENGKETLQIVGFAQHDWLKRQPNQSLKIEDTMCREDLAVLAVESSKEATSALKLVPPSKLKIK